MSRMFNWLITKERINYDRKKLCRNNHKLYKFYDLRDRKKLLALLKLAYFILLKSVTAFDAERNVVDQCC